MKFRQKTGKNTRKI